jgi:hypothetical protein
MTAGPRMSPEPMNPKKKAIVVNVALAAGLVVSYLTGQPLFAIILTAAVIFPSTNILMYLQSRKRNSR